MSPGVFQYTNVHEETRCDFEEEYQQHNPIKIGDKVRITTDYYASDTMQGDNGESDMLLTIPAPVKVGEVGTITDTEFWYDLSDDPEAYAKKPDSYHYTVDFGEAPAHYPLNFGGNRILSLGVKDFTLVAEGDVT